MIQQNLKTFLKYLLKNRLYTTVTLAGFSISLTFVILLSVYLYTEYNVNKVNVNYNRIYRLRNEHFDGFPPPMGQRLMDTYPEIECYTRLNKQSNVIDGQNGNKVMFDFLLADSTFFKIFTIPLLQGTPSTALRSKNGIVLTQRLAHKLFGEEPAMGKTVTIGTRLNLTVTGIIKTLTDGTNFDDCDAVVDFPFLADLWGSTDLLTSYGNSSFGLYLLAKPNTNLPARAPEMLESFKKDFWIYQDGQAKELVIEPMEDLYFSKIPGNGVRQNSRSSLHVLTAIVFSILLLAIINYMNLTIAQSGLRTRETAIKKLLGSSRKSLIYQYINESILLCLIAFGLALLLSLASQQLFNNLLNTNIDLHQFFNGRFLLIGLLSVFFIGWISGIIPAIIITKLNAVEVIKGSFKRKSKSVYSKVLISFQYVVVVILIITSITIFKQNRFMLNYNMGFNTTQILKMDFMINKDNKEGLRNKILQIPGVKNVSFVAGTPVDGGNNWSIMYHEKPVSFQVFSFDTAGMSIFNLHAVKTAAAYSKDGIYLNKKAVKVLELKELPENVVFYGNPTPVLGVVDNFNYASLHKEIGPALVTQLKDDEWPWAVLVQMEGNNLNQTTQEVKKAYLDFDGGVPFNSEFIDQAVNDWYTKEVRTGKVVAWFTLLTIVIALMGIFAMSIFYLQQKVKEIGIRKVNGAEVNEILTMVNSDFIKWVIIAFAVAMPIAYIVLKKWLHNFAYQTDLSWWIFALAGFITIVIALFTVSMQSLRAAKRNPVEALRYE